MSRYFPTLRGWIAFVLPAFAILYFPLLRTALIVESGRGTFVAEPVTPKVWIIGAFLIVVCLLAIAEAFKRGSRADKVVACISVLLTVGLAVQYFQLCVLSVHRSPNKALHRTAICAWGFAMEFLFFISQFVAVGELDRSDS